MRSVYPVQQLCIVIRQCNCNVNVMPRENQHILGSIVGEWRALGVKRGQWSPSIRDIAPINIHIVILYVCMYIFVYISAPCTSGHCSYTSLMYLYCAPILCQQRIVHWWLIYTTRGEIEGECESEDDLDAEQLATACCTSEQLSGEECTHLHGESNSSSCRLPPEDRPQS